MSDRFEFLIPVAGAHLPMPEDGFKPLPAAGRRVRMTPYWDHIVLTDKSAVIGVKPSKKLPEPEPVAKASKDKS